MPLEGINLPGRRDLMARLREETMAALVRFLRELRQTDIGGYVTLKGRALEGKGRPVSLDFMWGNFTLKGSEVKELFERAEGLDG